MNLPLLRIDRLGKRFGGFMALQGVSFDVGAGERLGLIGPHGSGKSTLLQIISGILQPTTGRVRHADGSASGLQFEVQQRR